MATRRKAPAKKKRQTPESLRLRGIAPSLTVGNLAASLAWYRDVVGFTVEETWEQNGKMQGVSLIAGNGYLMLNQDDWAKGRDRVKGEGLRLYFSTAQDVDQLAAGIKARGGRLASEPADQPWGARMFNLVDPDGFKVSITSIS